MEVEDLQQRVRLCPQCGSSAVDFSALVWGRSKCRVCAWEGSTEGLVNMPFDHMYGGDEGVALTLHNDLRALFSNPLVATGLIRFLTKWGFVPLGAAGSADVKLATRYISAMGRGLFKAVIEEREKIESEEKGDG